MVTRAFQAWEAAGRPWTKCRPVEDLESWARTAGVAVLGTIGNDEHLHEDHPLDHTPFSSTEWPYKVDAPVVFAIDLKNVRRDGVTLGEAIERQMRAGKLPWLKYMNHGHRHVDSRDLDGDGKRFEVEDSSDEHVHLSVRTDWIDKSIGDFDPWGRDDEMPTVEELLNGRVRLTEQTAKRINKKDGEGLGLGLLLQYAVIEAADAKGVSEATAKRLIGVEAQSRSNGDTLSQVSSQVAGLSQKLDQVMELLNAGVKLDPAVKPAEEPEPKKATPAALDKNAKRR